MAKKLAGRGRRKKKRVRRRARKAERRRLRLLGAAQSAGGAQAMATAVADTSTVETTEERAAYDDGHAYPKVAFGEPETEPHEDMELQPQVPEKSLLGTIVKGAVVIGAGAAIIELVDSAINPPSRRQ